MEKFIEFEKMSKKEKKKYNNKKRRFWEFNPVTRITKKNTYKRIKNISKESE